MSDLLSLAAVIATALTFAVFGGRFILRDDLRKRVADGQEGAVGWIPSLAGEFALGRPRKRLVKAADTAPHSPVLPHGLKDDRLTLSSHSFRTGTEAVQACCSAGNTLRVFGSQRHLS